MVRISDARMSGTAYGTVVLHVAPEAAAGGPLALVRDGDLIELDVAGAAPGADGLRGRACTSAARALDAARAAGEAATRASMSSTCCRPIEGCDFDFLVGRRDAGIPRHSPLRGA